MSAIAKQRLSPRAYIDLCLEHFRRYWWQYVLPIAVIGILQLFIRIDVNLSESLPDHVFITVKGYTSNIERGDYIAFEWPGGGPYPKGFHFVKIVRGVPGDVVRMDSDRNFYVKKASEVNVQDMSGERKLYAINVGGFGENHMGKAKTHSKRGEPLVAGPAGVIPPEHFYVFAPHPDSLDSRYALTGWIPREAIMGKTYAIF